MFAFIQIEKTSANLQVCPMVYRLEDTNPEMTIE